MLNTLRTELYVVQCDLCEGKGPPKGTSAAAEDAARDLGWVAEYITSKAVTFALCSSCLARLLGCLSRPQDDIDTVIYEPVDQNTP